MDMANANTSKGVARLKTIEAKKDSLIGRVEAFFDDRGDNPKIVVPVQRTQLQNLLRLALATSSVKEIQLFIRYQRARHNDWNKNNFGENLESQIGEVERRESCRCWVHA